jgi:hypothetical protein
MLTVLLVLVLLLAAAMVVLVLLVCLPQRVSTTAPEFTVFLSSPSPPRCAYRSLYRASQTILLVQPG